MSAANPTGSDPRDSRGCVHLLWLDGIEDNPTYEDRHHLRPESRRCRPPDVPDDYQEEFDSPATIEAIAAVLRGLGHEVVCSATAASCSQRLLADPPDFVFNFAEGHGVSRSREARVPAVLEMLGIPYTGSDPLTLAVTLDKDCAKRLVQSRRQLPSRWRSSTCRPTTPVALRARFACPTPVIVKPAWEGSSKGIRSHVPRARQPDDDARPSTRCVEPSAADPGGRIHRKATEVTVGMVGNDPPQIIGVMRVLPQRAGRAFVYSLEVKRDYRTESVTNAAGHLPAASCRAVGRPPPCRSFAAGLPRRGPRRFSAPGGRAVLPGSQSVAGPQSRRTATWSSCAACRVELRTLDRLDCRAACGVSRLRLRAEAANRQAGDEPH